MFALPDELRQPQVCALHHGITSGLVERIDGQRAVVGFEPKDPDRAGYMIAASRAIAESESGATESAPTRRRAAR